MVMCGYTYSPCVISHRCFVYKLWRFETDERTLQSLPRLTILQSLQTPSSRLLLRWSTASHLWGTKVLDVLQIILFLHVTITCILQIGLLFLSLHVLSSVSIELSKATHQTTYSTKQRRIRNFPTRYPIRHLFRNADQHPSTRHRGHRSRRHTAARVY